MESSLPDWIQALAAVFTMLAAFAALWVALKAPEMAASYAEKYRRETAIADEERAMQVAVFRALMKGRAEIAHQDTRATINLIEVAFPDNPRVRAARRMFTKAANAQPFDYQVMAQAYLSLLEAVTDAVGLNKQIDRFDLESGYYPRALGIMDEAALAESMAKIGKGETDRLDMTRD